MDFHFSDHGSICLLRPDTDRAVDWVSEHLPEDATWFGPSVAIERRYVGPILDGIVSDGLEVVA